METLRGQLLMAGGDMFDPNFRRTVVLIGEHNEEGALGAVLNRPAPFRIEEAVPPLASIVAPDDHLFFGGPVQPQSPVVLAEFEHPDLADLLVFGAVGFLSGEALPESRDGIVPRVFAGYAGWGPGQLEAEMEQGSWILEPAQDEDVFTTDPDQLWSSVLRRKGSAEYRLLASMPFDPSLN